MIKKRFTLIEIIAVIAVLGILAVIVIPNVSNKKQNAMITQVSSNIRNLQTATDMYALDNNGTFPSEIQPTLYVPSILNIGMLYPKYLKSMPENVLKEYYWVDFMGKVWASTVDAPNEILKTSNGFEWNNANDEISEYNIYEVVNKNVTGSSKGTFLSLKQSILNHNEIDKYISNTTSDYLVSAVDKHGLETAPVGAGYRGVDDTWFNPLIRFEGVIEFTHTSEKTMYWIDFWTEEKKPEGTDIAYEFKVKDENGTYGAYTRDFSSLAPSKSIMIKIMMTGIDGNLPSLMDFRLYYTYGDEAPNVLRPRENPNPTDPNNASEFEVVLDGSSTINQIIVPPGVIPTIKSPDGTVYISTSDVPKASTFIISYPKNNILNEILPSPIVITTQNPLVTHDIANIFKPEANTGTGHTKPVIPEQELKGWKNIQEIVYVGSTGEGEISRWLNIEINDKQPENTRILYYYSTSNGMGSSWSAYLTDFSKLPESRMIKVYAVLQIKDEVAETAKYPDEYPELYEIRINSTKGALDLDTVTPTVVITYKKDNNKNRDVLSTTSNIVWDFEAYDPQGLKITEVVWGGNKEETYETAGKYTVSIKVKNEHNYWSKEEKFTFDVKEEKPVAVIGPTDKDKFSNRFKVEFDSKSSYDPDGDGVDKIEWSGDYREDGMYPTGTITLKMRVQDKEGNWSDWTEKVVTMRNHRFYGFYLHSINSSKTELDEKVFDKNPNTYGDYKVPQIYWDGDLTGKVVYVDVQDGKYATPIKVLDKNGKELNYFDTNGVFRNQTSTYVRTQNYGIVIPKDAHSIKIDSSINIYDIYEETREANPVTIKNVDYTATKTSLTFDFDVENISEMKKIIILRNGTKVGETATTSFADTSLASGTEYTYQFYTVDTYGFTAEPFIHKAKTEERRILWSGLDPAAFDFDSTTRVSIASTQRISWVGDLSNQVVFIDSITSESSGNRIIVRDANLKAMPFYDTRGNYYANGEVGNYYRTNDLAIIMPKDAKYIEVTNRSHIYDIHELEDIRRPSNVSDISFVPEKTKMHITWNRPEDSSIKKIWIFRNGLKVGETTGNTFTDISLESNKTYTYNIYTVNENGMLSEAPDLTATTLPRDIYWSGLNPAAFDFDTTTRVSSTSTVRVTWTGDLTNKVVLVDTITGESSGNRIIVRDANLKALPFYDTRGNYYANGEVSNYYRTSSLEIIMPENAKYIEITNRSHIYDIHEK